ERHAGERFAQVAQAGGGGRVAGHDDHFGTAVEEKAGDPFGKAADLLQGAGAVGHVALVGKIEDILFGKLAAHLAQDRETADPGVEHGNGTCINHGTSCLLRDGNKKGGIHPPLNTYPAARPVYRVAETRSPVPVRRRPRPFIPAGPYTAGLAFTASASAERGGPCVHAGNRAWNGGCAPCARLPPC